MNRNKSPNSSNEATSGRKRRLKSPEVKESKGENLDKSKTTNEDDEDDEEEEQEEFRNRKSLRIKNKTTQSSTSSSPSNVITPKKTKESTNTASASANSTPVSTVLASKQKPASTSSIASSVNSSTGSDRKLNGAQFVAAAAAGNFNVSAAIGASSINIDPNSNQDLTLLNHNVEILAKTLSQHSILLKQLNGSIEKLSTRLQYAKANSKRMITSKSKVSAKHTSKRQKHNYVDPNDSLDEPITLDDSQADENESEKDEEHEEHETINNKSQQAAQQQQQQSTDLNKSDTNDAKLDEGNEIKLENKSPVKQPPVVSAPSFQQPRLANELTNCISEAITTQTVKLTNIDSISDDNPRQSSNSFYYLSDSSKSDNDDDDDDDDDEDGNMIFQETDGKKSRRSSHGQKSPTKAILNKTKIDTEFISKLIANKDPNDKRYDPNEINKLRLLSHSYQNFAVKLLIRLFDEDEIIGRNVYGRNYSGDKSFMKQPLDPERINFIKETVLKLTKTNNPELAWASCVIAMNRKMVDINNKFIKSHKNNSANLAANTTI